ncbi:MAG: hypothetical protein HWN80_14200 [Candidatus Lokiarchaeota archaeon]|nr:hypothetical protein [Candidatus Lokiarchaeota archaeon]
MGKENRVFLRSYPKAIFLYPLFFCTLIIFILQWTDELWALWSNLFEITNLHLRNNLSFVWLIFLFFCLFVVSIEIKLTKLIAVVFVVLLIFMLLGYIIGIEIWNLIPNPGEQNLALPNLFYLLVSIILAIILGSILIGAHFDYAKIEPNQITCTKGISGKSKETFPTRALEIDIQRPDFLEQLLGTGCISLKIPSLNKFIQLNTIFRAGTKHKKILHVLKAISADDIAT